MQLQPSQLNEAANHPCQAASSVSQPASQQASQPANRQSPENPKFPPTTCSCSQVSSAGQLASQASQPASQFCQPASLPASEPASQATSRQSPKRTQFPPTTCSCSRVSSASQLAIQVSQPAHDLSRVPSFLQQHAVAAKSAQRVSQPG